ncbi:MAG: alpha/beta fold hydrolase [Alphaproteobacteria bacterium]|nr:alpha/beta fold hydrolase [Alphaproteobacteria bacterium]
MVTQLLTTGPGHAAMTIVLAHGAGAGAESPFLTEFADGLGARGFRVVRFNFPYMEKQQASGRRRPPDREPALRESWQSVINSLAADRLVIGGKSLGGRIASLVADSTGAAGLICLGYPFHPPGKPDRLRTEHLATLNTPTLICQGTRDPFGTIEEVPQYRLSKAIQLHWLGDGDHSFKPRKASGRTLAQNCEEAMDAVAAFCRGLAS